MAGTHLEPARETSPAADRLDSWKEIAVYLDRGLRTVQRWEKEQGLPVHRHSNGGHGSVFAFRSEIDGWWGSHRSDLEGDSESGSTAEPKLFARFRVPWLLWTLGAGSALAMAAMVAWNGRSSVQARPDQPTMQRVFELNWNPIQVSPDGRFVAHADSKTGQLLIEERGGRGPARQIEVRNIAAAAWGPDSRRLAALTWPPEPDAGPLRQMEIIDIETSERRVAWKGPRNEAPFPWDWTPDGQTIIAGIEEPDLSIQLVALSLADGAQTPIAELPKRADDGVVSPDGRFLAFSACPDDSQCDIYVIPLEGGDPIRLTRSRAQDQNPAWSPDGNYVLFLSERLGSEGDLWAVRIDRSSGNVLDQPFLVREFGRRVMGGFTLTRQGELFFTWQPKLPRVFLLDVNPATGVSAGDPESPLSNNTFAPYWIEGGRKLGYRQGGIGGNLLFLDIATAREEQIGVPGHPHASPLTPSPDGRHLAFFEVSGKERRTIWTYEVGGKQAAPFRELEGGVNYPFVWAPEGDRLLFTVTRRQPLRQLIRVAQGNGGQTNTIAETTGRPPFVAWSPDGAQVAYNDGNCVFAVPAAGGEAPRRITCAPRSEMTDGVSNVGPMGHLTWSPDGDKLAWIINNPDYKRIEMRVVDVGTGTQSLSWAGEPDYESWPKWPAWSPKGDQIAFEMDYKKRFEVWALSGFLSQLQLSD